MARAGKLMRQAPVLMLAALALLAGAAMTLCAPASAQDYPNRPIRILIPFPPGSAADLIARLMASDMSASLGTSVLVESRAGASGNIAMDAAAKAAPDGYLIILASASLSINKALIKATPFDPQKDFTPISLVAMVPSILVAGRTFPHESVADFIAAAKAKPGALNYGTNGVGTSQHLAASMFRVRTGTDITHVPYKGADQLVPDLVNGRIHVAFYNIPSVQGQLKAGGVKALAIGRKSRWDGLPQVPTYAEAGIGGLEYPGWVALLGPAGLPPAITERLHRAAVRALQNPESRDKIQASANEVVAGTPAALAAFISSEIEQWTRAIAAAGLKAE
ncbi:MAG: Bug family tripartite tricarboxylate transporter substrate binding protein [Burkholderiales bacterium]